ncbi:DUF2285 domain-containing protein [Asticcacaulis sp.]|uniref:DUF2285 domain-containing protein n=1 Tax=Asticcacaulis sp. TaxID=1872648 RepID=UPI002C8B9D4F|nr:DUF2285 domain-containing protein [Asticcacaulis sp.]HTM81556.1 DUF2285 domain-containing protein [Asticcacaulis sp.]
MFATTGPEQPFLDGVFVHLGRSGDGDQDARLFWQPGWDPTAITIDAEPVPPTHQDAFDIARYPDMAGLLMDDNGHEVLLLCDGPRQIQLEVANGTLTAGPVRLHAMITGFDHMPSKAQTLLRLDAFQRLGRFPKTLFPPERGAVKWAKALRAFDGAQTGANHKEIATQVFGAGIVQDEWNGRSDFLRARVQRLIKYARKMVDGGYKQLLG